MRPVRKFSWSLTASSVSELLPRSENWSRIESENPCSHGDHRHGADEDAERGQEAAQAMGV
jgi:hypothetical protein